MARKTWLFVIYLIVALYLFNWAFSFFVLPNFFLEFGKWVFVAAGIIIILEGFKYLKETYDI